MQKEIWETVKDFDEYQISNHGRVRKNGRVLKTPRDKYGYPCIWLRQDGRKKNWKVHRLVAIAFIPNPEDKPCVNHKDNNPENPYVENLEWCTHKENTRWMMLQGRAVRTDQWLQRLHDTQKLTQWKPVIGINIATGNEIRFEFLNSVQEAGFQPSCVSNCCNGKRRQHGGYIWRFSGGARV